MHFQAAYSYLKQGHAITLPEWGGYWTWNGPRKTIVMHTREGDIIDIRDSEDMDYTIGFMFRDDWELVDDITTKPDFVKSDGKTAWGVLKVDGMPEPICQICQGRHSPNLPCPALTV